MHTPVPARRSLNLFAHQPHIHCIGTFGAHFYFEHHTVIFPKGSGEVVDVYKNAVFGCRVDDEAVAFFFVEELDLALVRDFGCGISRRSTQSNVLSLENFLFGGVRGRGGQEAVLIDVGEHLFQGLRAALGLVGFALFLALQFFLVFLSAKFFFFSMNFSNLCQTIYCNAEKYELIQNFHH